MVQIKTEPNSEFHKSNRKLFGLSLVSMGLGIISVCPSLGIIDLINTPPGSAGDFQGGGMILLAIIFLIGVISSFTSFISGTVVLFKVITSEKERKILIAPAIIGILLGLPGIVSLFLVFSTIG